MTEPEIFIPDYRSEFVSRAIQTLEGYKGGLPYEVKLITAELQKGKHPQDLAPAEFNLLNNLAEQIETNRKIS